MRKLLVALVITLGLMAGCNAANGHTAPQEDEAGWSCVSDGNRICGPGNSEGVPAGCYDDGGVMVAAWPCHVVVRSDGEGDVYAD